MKELEDLIMSGRVYTRSPSTNKLLSLSVKCPFNIMRYQFGTTFRPNAIKMLKNKFHGSIKDNSVILYAIDGGKA